MSSDSFTETSNRSFGSRITGAVAGMIFAPLAFLGGCGLLFLINQDGLYVTWEAVATLAGPPFAIGLLVWWLAMRRRKPEPVEGP